MRRMRALLLAAAAAFLTALGASGTGPGYALAQATPTPTPRPPRLAGLPDNASPATPGPATSAAPAGSSLINLSAHVLIYSDDPRTAQLKAGWAWATSTYSNPKPSDGSTEFTRWIQVCSISPESGTCTGQLAAAFRSLTPDYQVERVFVENQMLLLDKPPREDLRSLIVPGSLIGMTLPQLKALIAKDPGWMGPETSSGPGRYQYWLQTSEDTGHQLADEIRAYPVGDPEPPVSATGAAAPLYEGPHFVCIFGNTVYDVAGAGNPALTNDRYITYREFQASADLTTMRLVSESTSNVPLSAAEPADGGDGEAPGAAGPGDPPPAGE